MLYVTVHKRLIRNLARLMYFLLNIRFRNQRVIAKNHNKDFSEEKGIENRTPFLLVFI